MTDQRPHGAPSAGERAEEPPLTATPQERQDLTGGLPQGPDSLAAANGWPGGSSLGPGETAPGGHVAGGGDSATTAALPLVSSDVPPGPAPAESRPGGSFALPDTPRPAPSTAPTAVESGRGWGAPAPPAPAPAPADAPRPLGRRADNRVAGPRRAQLSLQRIDPGSVLKVSFLLSLLLAVVLLVATTVLYAALAALGVLSALDTFASELGVVSEGQPLLTLSTVLGVTALVAIVDIVLVTVLSTLYAFLYNVCAALTGGISVTLAERD